MYVYCISYNSKAHDTPNAFYRSSLKGRSPVQCPPRNGFLVPLCASLTLSLFFLLVYVSVSVSHPSFIHTSNVKKAQTEKSWNPLKGWEARTAPSIHSRFPPFTSARLWLSRQTRQQPGVLQIILGKSKTMVFNFHWQLTVKSRHQGNIHCSALASVQTVAILCGQTVG